MGASSGKHAAVDNEVFLAYRRLLEPAFEDFSKTGFSVAQRKT